VGILIEASINCDLSGPGGCHCYSCLEFDTYGHVDDCLEDYAFDGALAAGWVYLSESGHWACPECVKKHGGKEAIKMKDFEGTL